MKRSHFESETENIHHFKMDSDTDSSTNSSRLGKCEVCNIQDAKYTCPKCEVKTCCLNCLKIHKIELNCDGIRDRTKYIPLNKMTKLDFMNDYNFLEECTRYVEDRKQDKIKHITRYNKMLPTKLMKLRNAALKRNITLRFLLDNFKRRKENTTYWNSKDDTIYWRIEWLFVNAGNLQYIDEKCSENEKLSSLLRKYLNVTENCDSVPMKKSLEYFQSKGIGNIKILLKAEGIKRCKNRYYKMDCRKTLKQNLEGKTIVEFPLIVLCYDESIDEFDIIDSDEDVVEEAKQYRKTLDDIHKKQLEEIELHVKAKIEENESKKPEDIHDELKQLLIERKRDERRKKKEELEKEPQNYLFSDERLLDVLSSSDDEGNETEEEKLS